MDWNTLSIIGAVAASSLATGVYMSDRFSKMKDEFTIAINTLDAKFTNALSEHKDTDSEKFHDHSLRLFRLELSEFNVIKTGKNPDKMDFLGIDKPSP